MCRQNHGSCSVPSQERQRQVTEACVTPGGTHPASGLLPSPSSDACLSVSPAASDGAETAAAPSPSIFFARVPSTMSYGELHALFSKFGTVQHLNLFKRWAKAKTSKGCGTVQYGSVEEASTALKTLNGIHRFDYVPGCEGPMVVEWMDPSRIRAVPPNSTIATQKKKSSRQQSNTPPASIKGHKMLWGAAASSSRTSQQSWSGLPQQPFTGCSTAAVAACNSGVQSVNSLHHAVALNTCSEVPPSPDGLVVLGVAQQGFAGPNRGCGSPGMPVHLLPVLINEARAIQSTPPLAQLDARVPAAIQAVANTGAVAPIAAGAAAVPAHVPNLAGPQLLPMCTSALLGYPGPASLDASWLHAGLSSQSAGNCYMFKTDTVSSSALLAALQQQRQLDSPQFASDSSGRSDPCLSTGRFNLLDSSVLPCNLQGTAALAAAAVVHSPASMFGSCNAAAAYSCGFSPAAASPSFGAAVGTLQKQQPVSTIYLELSDTTWPQIMPHIRQVAKMSGAELQVLAGPSGMQLCLQGCAEQLEAACILLQLLISAA